MSSNSTNIDTFHNCGRNKCVFKQHLGNLKQKQKMFDVDSSNYIFATPRSKYDPNFPQQQTTSIRMNYDQGTPCNMS